MLKLPHPRWTPGLVFLLASVMVWSLACGGAEDAGRSSAPQVGAADSPPVTAPGTGAPPDEPSAPAGIAASPLADLPPGSGVGQRAPELTGITNWINSEPLRLEDLRGRVVLMDVWTYTCINCIRTFPYLRQWHHRYADTGLVIIGLHAPEFEFEKDARNVARAAREHGIVWPIAQDNDFSTWRAYNNRYWPAKYLIDQHGVVRYTHFGEGAYAETEEVIRRLLQEAGAQLTYEHLALPPDQPRDPAFDDLRRARGSKVEITPELYAGYERNFSAVHYRIDPYVVQTEYYKNRDGVATLTVPDKLVPHKIYLHGQWFIGPESVRHARDTRSYEDYVTVKYSAKSVNAVITPGSGNPYRIRVIMDGKYLTRENRGRDVMIAPDGESFILVDEPRMYSIVENPRYLERRVLELRANSSDFGIYAFTFGVYQEGP
jgi:thiol-disulfide isomerase/thioredoxin